MYFTESRIVPVVNGQHLGAAPFHFEGEPPVPGPNVENSFSAQVIRDRKTRDPIFKSGECRYPLDMRPIGELEAVPPAFVGAFLMPFANVSERVRRTCFVSHPIR